MNIGKLTNEQLQQSVLSILKPMRSEVFLRAGIGEDCAALSFGDNLCVVVNRSRNRRAKGPGKVGRAYQLQRCRLQRC